MKKHPTEWLTPKGYIHFTNKFDLSDEETYKFIHSYVKTPASIAKHSFYPLIHRKLISRRYKKIGKDESGKTIRAHSKVQNGKTISNAKERHVYYSTHIDAVIYAYYTQEVLAPLYEKEVSKVDGLSDCISAYRKIPIGNGIDGNKNNIHFADDVFKYIKGLTECTVLTFDVSAFFDSLNHKLLNLRAKNTIDKLGFKEPSLIKERGMRIKNALIPSTAEEDELIRKACGISNRKAVKK